MNMMIIVKIILAGGIIISALYALDRYMNKK